MGRVAFFTSSPWIDGFVLEDTKDLVAYEVEQILDFVFQSVSGLEWDIAEIDRPQSESNATISITKEMYSAADDEEFLIVIARLFGGPPWLVGPPVITQFP